MIAILAALTLAAQPIDTYLDYDGQLIELPPSICVATSPIEYGPAGLVIPNGIVCRDRIFAGDFDG